MNTISKLMLPFLSIWFFSTILTSCQSSMEERIENIKGTLVKKKNIGEITYIETYENDSIFLWSKDTLAMEGIKKYHKSAYELENSIKEFKSLLRDSTNRIWRKTFTPEQKDSYLKYNNEQMKASSALNDLGLYSLSFIPDSITKNHCTHVRIKTLIGNTTKEYLGVFYFNNPSQPNEVSTYYLISMEEVSQLPTWYAKSIQDRSIPTLEKLGIDVVPEDEDPTKTPEEREKIKFQQAKQRRIEEEKKIEAEIISGIREFVKSMNKGGSTRVDEMTTFIKSSLTGNTINIYYNILANKNDYSDYQWEAYGSMMEQSLKEQCQNVLQYFVNNGPSRYEVKNAFNRLGIRWNYIYRDYTGRHLFTVAIDANDLN